MPKTGVIRFRCDEDLAARFARVAAMRRREGSDLARIWFEDLVLAEEQRLGLILNSAPSPAFSAIFDAASSNARAAQVAPPAPVQPVSYKVQQQTKTPRNPAPRKK